ncbi:hypothetical protein [Saccharothrix sp. ST-888]|uniref:hypothetical protein n=1 Tax=Saccharothrix sp. ST-888 TaxID=1427391 RepID=UPI000696654A|nr:hypothetical protein [Saccharothrix sp. ST-888]
MTAGNGELADLLRRAGLEIVGDGGAVNVLPPKAAWRPVAAASTRPTAEVRDDHPDLVAELNAQWRRLATEYGVLGADGEFLLDALTSPRGWLRVRLTEHWDLAGVLGPRPGRPEFVTLSADGDSLLGVTTEEYSVWLIAVDRLGERLEAEARARATESPEEQAACWQSFRRFTSAPERLRRAWLEGLAGNPAAPAAVLRRLLTVDPAERVWSALLDRELPPEVVAAWLAHPDWTVRRRLVESRHLSAQDRTQLLADAEPEDRTVLAMLTATMGEPLTEAGYAGLAADRDPRVRAEIARHPDLPVQLLGALAADPDSLVRSRAATRAHPRPRPIRPTDEPECTAAESTTETVELRSRDQDPEVRYQALRDSRLSPASVVRLLDDPQDWIRNAAAGDARLPARVLTALLHGTETARSAAANPAVPVAGMHHLLDRAGVGSPPPPAQ